MNKMRHSLEEAWLDAIDSCGADLTPDAIANLGQLKAMFFGGALATLRLLRDGTSVSDIERDIETIMKHWPIRRRSRENPHP